MNEMQLGNKVRQVLNRGLVGVKDDPRERLRAARERALARQRPEPSPAMAWADNVLGRVGGWGGVARRVLLPIAMLIVALAAGQYWQQNKRIAEIEEIDAQLLTDDLPIDAYLDRGFQNWLKQRGTGELSCARRRCLPSPWAWREASSPSRPKRKLPASRLRSPR